MATDDGKRDWYDANLTALLIVFAASVVAFLLLAMLLLVCLRLQFAASRADATRGSIDSLELTLVKSHTRATRLLSLAGILLQLALVKLLNGDSDSASASERAPFLFSLVRPVVNVCVYFMGFMTNTHGAFRVLFLLLLCIVVVCDTVAEVQVAMMIDCSASQGLKCGSSGHLFTDAATLQALQTRDLFSLFLNPWLLLEVGYLCVAVGVCGSRFSNRQLSLSRPRFNVRAGLALHFPDQFARPPRRAATSALTAKSASRRSTSPSRSRVHAVELHDA